MADRLTEAELLALGRDVYENYEPGFCYRGRVMGNVEMLATSRYQKSAEFVFSRRVDDWCERFDKWVMENLHDGHGIDSAAETGRANGRYPAENDRG
jgi:hypothetical protein